MAKHFHAETRQIDEASDPRVITEAEPPYRIVHVNGAWCESMGYSRSALIGNTCKILQGPETCVQTMQVRVDGHDALMRCICSSSASAPARPSPVGCEALARTLSDLH